MDAPGTGKYAAPRPDGLRAPSEPRERRFLRFAFTAADLLLEVGRDGTICYATGAFGARLGAPAETFLGQDISRLIVPADHGVLASALAQAAQSGRIAPTVVHLNNAAREAVCFAALKDSDGAGGLSVTLGRVPEPSEATMGADAFRLEARARLKNSGSGTLSLLEVLGEERPGRPADGRGAVADIASRLGEAGGETATGGRPLVGTLAPGRFGLISDAPVDLEKLCARVERVCRESGETVTAKAAGFALAGEGSEPGGAQRALRLALRSFGEGGLRRLHEAGFAHGLPGFIARAAEQRQAMQRTIAGRRFELQFQPVVGLADRTVCHYEALLRLSPDAGGRPPSTQEFVTAAETAGLAEELDAAVMEEALGVLREVPQAAIAVNVSGLSFQSPGFRKWLLGFLEKGLGRRSRLLVELTETAEIEDLAAAGQTLEALRKAGIAVCLDDFGAGQAAFRYLREFSADYIKIDGSFLHAAERSTRERAMLGAMVALARDVGAKVVVEMIESAEEEALSRALGADLGQGWLYGRPGRLPGSALGRRSEPHGERRTA